MKGFAKAGRVGLVATAGFDVEYDITPGVARQGELAQGQGDHAKRLTFEQMKRQIETVMPEVPLFKPWFELLRFITTTAHVIATVAPLCKRPVVQSASKEPTESKELWVPHHMPAMPVRVVRAVVIDMTVQALMATVQGVLRTHLNQDVGAVLTGKARPVITPRWNAICVERAGAFIRARVGDAGLRVDEYNDADLGLPDVGHEFARVLLRSATAARRECIASVRGHMTSQAEMQLPHRVRELLVVPEPVAELGAWLELCCAAVQRALREVSLIPRAEVLRTTFTDREFFAVQAEQEADLVASSNKAYQQLEAEGVAVRAQLAQRRAALEWQAVNPPPGHAVDPAKLANARVEFNNMENDIESQVLAKRQDIAQQVARLRVEANQKLLECKEKAVRAAWVAALMQSKQCLEGVGTGLREPILDLASGSDFVLLRQLRLSSLELNVVQEQYVGGCGTKLDVCPPMLHTATDHTLQATCAGS
jgi:hypothetical protein